MQNYFDPSVAKTDVPNADFFLILLLLAVVVLVFRRPLRNLIDRFKR